MVGGRQIFGATCCPISNSTLKIWTAMCLNYSKGKGQPRTGHDDPEGE